MLFYFAGHGRRSAQAGRLYLVATDTESEFLRSTGIPIDRILDFIRESRCDNRAVVLDCCHSGAVGEGFRGGDIDSGLSDLARQNAGTYILTASTAIELAAERESAAGDGTSGNGIFTRYFIEALETGNASSGDSDEITIDAVHDYIQQRVTSQRPQRFVLGGMGRFVVERSVVGHWEGRRKDLLSRFRQLVDQDIISDQHYVAAARIIRASWPALSVDQQSIGRRALDVLDGKLTVTAFCSYLDAAAARLVEEEARRKAAAEVLERQRVEDERRRQEEEAERVAQEERRRKTAERQRLERDAAAEREAERRKKEEDERRHAEEERRHQEAEAKR